MGVRRLVPWTTFSTTALADVQSAIFSLNDGAKRSPWRVAVTSHASADASARAGVQRMYKVTFSEDPTKCYTVLDKMKKSSGQQAVKRESVNVLESDAQFPLILAKTRRFKEKHTVVIEGYRYDLGDFVVRVGTLSVRGQPHGCLLEVEYTPCMSSELAEDCHGLVAEFVDLLLPPSPPVPAPRAPAAEGETPAAPPDTSARRHVDVDYQDRNFAGECACAGLPIFYSNRHLALQYVRVLNAKKVA